MVLHHRLLTYLASRSVPKLISSAPLASAHGRKWTRSSTRSSMWAPLRPWTLSRSTYGSGRSPSTSKRARLSVFGSRGLQGLAKHWKRRKPVAQHVNKLTHLTLQFPVLSDLDKGPEETAYEWYKRCHADGLRLDCALCTVRVLLEAQYIDIYWQ